MTISPVLDPEVETEVEKETAKASEPKIPASLRPKPRTVLEEIFEGHQDFLACTPDSEKRPEL
jgi:hypothetical protein